MLPAVNTNRHYHFAAKNMLVSLTRNKYSKFYQPMSVLSSYYITVIILEQALYLG